MGNVLVNDINQLIGTDMMGPLPMSRGGVQYVLVFVDVFSKHIICRALKKANATAILRVFETVYLPQAGKPAAILSDNGSQFRSKNWINRLKELGVKCFHTSVYYPQGNMTERVNREIGRLLRYFCAKKHTKWAEKLSQIESLINHAIHESTGYAPVEVHFGTTPNLLSLENLNFPELYTIPGNIIMLTREKLVAKAERRKLKHDRKHQTVVFQPGDRVWVRNVEASSAQNKEIKKMFALYKGPYQISRVAGNNAYKLTDNDGGTLGIHNVTNLKKYRPQVDHL